MEGPVTRLLLERAFPREARLAMDRDLARWYLHELNALGDLLRTLEESSVPERSERLRAARARLDGLVAAFGAAKADLIPCVWDYLERPLEHPEDAFAPAVLLQAHEEGPRPRQWLERLTGEEREAATLIERLNRTAGD